MADEECATNGTSVGIAVATAQHSHVMIVVVVIDGTVECQQNHLRNLKRKKGNESKTEGYGEDGAGTTFIMMLIIFHMLYDDFMISSDEDSFTRRRM